MARMRAIPTASNLQESLGYTDIGAPQNQTFYDEIEAFRTSFRTTKGREGSRLLGWKRERKLLSEMSHYFLEQGKRGSKFWPDEDTSPGRQLRYSVDKIRIRRLVAQLFWRLNLKHNNKKKKHISVENKSSQDREYSSLTHSVTTNTFDDWWPDCVFETFDNIAFASVAEPFTGETSVRITHWVYQDPTSHCILWVPNRPVSTMTLCEFEAELSVSIEPTTTTQYGFRFTAPQAQFNISIRHGNVEMFKQMKQGVQRTLSRSIARRARRGDYSPVMGRMEIEVFRD